MRTPVILTIFNQPDITRRVFEAIRKAKPQMLFVVADGPRTADEAILCQKTRAVAEDVDWPCQLIKIYSDKNMGARDRLSSGITEAFTMVDRAIILEYDCLPDQSFFQFCEELLEQYKDDERIMHIAGGNFQQSNSSFVCDNSYYFSIVPLIWGFATWARAWKHYDVNVRLWPQIKKEGWLDNVFDDAAVRERWEFRFEQYYRSEVNSWDGQWAFACIINNGLSITPKTNLVTNIGFGPHALNNKVPNEFAEIPLVPMKFPLVHPIAILPDREADAYTFKKAFTIDTSPLQRVRLFLKNSFPKIYQYLKLANKKTAPSGSGQ